MTVRAHTYKTLFLKVSDGREGWAVVCDDCGTSDSDRLYATEKKALARIGELQGRMMFARGILPTAGLARRTRKQRAAKRIDKQRQSP